MKQSGLFYKTFKEKPKNAKAISHILLLRAGFLDQLTGGVYTFLPLGLRVLKKIENIVREEMTSEEIKGQEILMPVLHPRENWEKTGRWKSFEVLFRLKGMSGKEYALGPTHEEVISPLVKKFIFSYNDLPLYLFQIQTKFRNEPRVKSGLLRTREFLMKDLYSFHRDEKDLNIFYNKMANAYLRIFKKCGIVKNKRGKIITFQTLASGGTFSKYSHEFQTITEAGEDTIFICQKCQLAINDDIKKNHPSCPKCGSKKFIKEKAVEVGNIFKLGTKYSVPFDLKYKDKEGKEKPVLMGCYGIGLGRLMATIVEVNHDKDGIVWPKNVSPFQIHLISIENNSRVRRETEKIYEKVKDSGVEILYDDRKDVSAGEKMVEADLIGIFMRVVVSERTLSKNSVEIKERGKRGIKLVKIKGLLDFIKSKFNRVYA